MSLHSLLFILLLPELLGRQDAEGRRVASEHREEQPWGLALDPRSAQEVGSGLMAGSLGVPFRAQQGRSGWSRRERVPAGTWGAQVAPGCRRWALLIYQGSQGRNRGWVRGNSEDLCLVLRFKGRSEPQNPGSWERLGKEDMEEGD